jgi:elongation of very long chain fatty acids protein 6
MVGCALGYMVVIYLLVRIMERRKPFDLRRLLVLWNSILSLSSAAGMVLVVPYCISELMRMGVTDFICSEHWHRVPAVVIPMSLFVFSKIPELIDTVFLALRKREIMLLHWYHHVSVLLFVWWSR